MKCKDCHGERGGARRLRIATGRPGCRVPSSGPTGRTAGLVAPLILFLFAVGLLRAAPSSPTTQPAGDPIVIRIWPKAVVLTETVRLEDIARIGQGAEPFVGELRLCEVVAAPSPGASIVLGLDDISAALDRAGVSPARVLLRGAAHCEVSRPGASVPDKPPATRPAEPVRRAVGPSGTASRPAEVGEGTLEQAIRRHLEARLAGMEGRVDIRFSPAARSALSLSGPEYEFRVRDRGDEPLGLVSLEVDVLQNGRVVNTVPVVAEVALIKRVVVSRTAINRGDVIKARQLQLAERRFTRPGEIGLCDLQGVVGQEAARFIVQGAMLTARDVKSRPLVHRNDTVTVWVRQGDLVIKTVAKALRPGTYGETIELKNEATGETFAATVTGPQTAEIGREASRAAESRERGIAQAGETR